MSDYIASDDANPNFVGQKDPDRALSVLFYTKALQNEYESAQQGRPIFFDVDMVKIFLPGDDKNIIATYARDDHKERFPRQWAHYKNKKQGDQQMIGKTPLSSWPRLTQSQVEELRAMKFFAVDDIANASDAALQRIGMVGGMSAFAFREAAQRFLQIAERDSKDSKLQKQLAEQTTANEELKQQMAAMQDQLSKLAQATEA